MSYCRIFEIIYFFTILILSLMSIQCTYDFIWGFGVSRHKNMGACVCALSCPTLCDPMDCSLLSSSVHVILQARILEWLAMPSSRGSSWHKDWTLVSCVSCIAGRFFTTEPPGIKFFFEIFLLLISLSTKESMFPNCGAREDSWESLGHQGDQISSS